MINFHDIGVNFASKAHNERIKHAQMLCNFTPNNDFINHNTKELNFHSISTILPLNVLANIRAILIPYSPIEDRILWGFSKDGKFSLKSPN